MWAAWAVTTGPQALDWTLEEGNWTVAVMNNDGSPGVGVDMALGVRMVNLVARAWLAVTLGLIFIVGGGFLLYRGLRPPKAPKEIVDLREEAAAAERVPPEKEPAETS